MGRALCREVEPLSGLYLADDLVILDADKGLDPSHEDFPAAHPEHPHVTQTGKPPEVDALWSHPLDGKLTAGSWDKIHNNKNIAIAEQANQNIAIGSYIRFNMGQRSSQNLKPLCCIPSILANLKCPSTPPPSLPPPLCRHGVCVCVRKESTSKRHHFHVTVITHCLCVIRPPDLIPLPLTIALQMFRQKFEVLEILLSTSILH